ncbi:MAG TPA: hypothetical protein VK689_08445 [Armatimonadota bacterium]|jgi:hypothetical protein|nr:hypothetical protein [Armatimonadota bacterium]
MMRWIARIRAKWQAMSHQEFAHWASGVQSLLIAVGVLIGAGWTVYLYAALKQEDNAATSYLRSQADLQSMQLNLQKAQEEWHRAYGLVTLTTAPVGGDSVSPCYLQVNATVNNAGNREIRLWFGGDSTPPLNVAQVSVDSAHRFDFRAIAHVPVLAFTPQGDTVLPMRQSKLLPGETSTYPFLVRIPDNSIYLVQFRVPVDTARPHNSKPPQPDSVWFWAARSYVSGCKASRGAPTQTTAERQPRLSAERS